MSLLLYCDRMITESQSQDEIHQTIYKTLEKSFLFRKLAYTAICKNNYPGVHTYEIIIGRGRHDHLLMVYCSHYIQHPQCFVHLVWWR